MGFINDGYQTTVTITDSASGALYLNMREVTPPGVDGGGENDTTTMANLVWRTRQPKALKTLTPLSFTAKYDPQVYDFMVSMVNVNQQITITFPDLTSLVFWGWLDKFTPAGLSEGTIGLANCTIVPSNQNDSGVEAAPIYID